MYCINMKYTKMKVHVIRMLFLYRAAMKMANMDAVFDFMFTGMRDKSGVSCVQFIMLSEYGNITLHACTVRYVYRYFNIMANY